MTTSETIVDTKEKYRNHYIRVTVTATPPLPHDDDEGGVEATVKVYDGVPGDMGMISLGETFAGSVVDTWSAPIPLYDSEEKIEQLIEQAKDRIDTRAGQQYGVRESTAIALERAVSDEGGE